MSLSMLSLLLSPKICDQIFGSVGTSKNALYVQELMERLQKVNPSCLIMAFVQIRFPKRDPIPLSSIHTGDLGPVITSDDNFRDPHDELAIIFGRPQKIRP